MITGNGVDIIEVRRIKSAIDKYNQSFLKRIFTDRELAIARQHNRFYQHLAGRFAVKEAVFKAFGNLKLSFRDVEVLNDSQGKPRCSLSERKQKEIFRQAKAPEKFDIHISISHIKNYAVASAIISQENNRP